jgi:hypothetical protein
MSVNSAFAFCDFYSKLSKQTTVIVDVVEVIFPGVTVEVTVCENALLIFPMSV